MKTVFELISENLSGLGGPMGTERTSINYRKLFDSIESAKHDAELNYGKRIQWKKNTNTTANANDIHSGDLNYVMYYINEITIN